MIQLTILPTGYIHQVRSYKGNRTISATMLFTVSLDNTFNNSSCENETYEYRPLSEAQVHWTYNKGDKTIDMGYQNVEKFRQYFLSSFDSLQVRALLRGQVELLKWIKWRLETNPLTFITKEFSNWEPLMKQLNWDTLIELDCYFRCFCKGEGRGLRRPQPFTP